ncbi:hypothetical protein lerEdw1_008423 [Lerista edwardsae]|nr:hypothetical protein lerEdw1_008423 [Lerista edwardsae]
MLRGLVVARGVALLRGRAPLRRLWSERAGSPHSRWGPPRRRFLAFGGVLGLALGLNLAVASTMGADDEGEDGGEPEVPSRKRGFSRAVQRSRDLLQRVKDEAGAPGIVIGVSVDGKVVWSEGEWLFLLSLED